MFQQIAVRLSQFLFCHTKSCVCEKNSLFYCVCLLNFLFLMNMPTPAKADILIFKNDDRITGQIVAVSLESCFYSLLDGPKPLEISWNQIRVLKTSEDYVITLNNDDRITGKLEYKEGRGLSIISKQIGARALRIIDFKDFQMVSSAKSQSPQGGVDQIVETDGTQEIEGEKQEFGQDGTEEAPTTFLRGSTVLLLPREIEARVAFTYMPTTTSNTYFSRQQRSLTTTLGVNVGLLEGLEGWINLPFSYISSRQDGYFGSGRDKAFALNDISFGLNKILIRENETWPEITLSLGGSAPTGKSSYDTDDIYTTGNGHWRADAGLHFVWTADPAILFMGAAAGYTWPKHLNNQATYNYDWDYNYYLGAGFAVNEKVSFSARVLGVYQPAVEFNGDREGRYSSDYFYGSLGIGYRINSKTVFEPQFTFGLNNASDTTQLRLGFSRKF